MYEYFIQKQVIKELMESGGEVLRLEDTCLSKSLLKDDLDLLRSIGKDLNYIKNDVKAKQIFPCLIKCVQ